jgi:hypothetical protein
MAQAAAVQPKEQTLLVRIKPFNGKTNKTRTYTYRSFSFREESGWYEVDKNAAEYLRTLRVGQDLPGDGENPEGALIFDVCTQAEAIALDEDERQRKEAKNARPAGKPQRRVTQVPEGTLTTRDLPRAEQAGDESDLEAEDLADIVEKEDKPEPAAKRASSKKTSAAIPGAPEPKPAPRRTTTATTK